MASFAATDWERLGCPDARVPLPLPPLPPLPQLTPPAPPAPPTPSGPDPWLGDRFESAVGYALRVHGGQVRKATPVPYLSHLLGVAALVLDNRGTEDEAIAGLLHDAAEDQGGEERLADIRRRFGDRVGDIVAACSDTFEEPKPPWACRKRRYIEHLETVADQGILLVSCADKLWNARAIIRDLIDNEHLFDAFNMKDPGRQVTYYQLLERVYSTNLHDHRALAREFSRAVAEFTEVVAR